jgi:ABC-type arginine transport system ATPase subunit
MVNFINCVADFPDPASLGTDSWTLISSLRASSDALKYDMGLQFDDDSTSRRKNCDADISMPPQEAAVLLLRWARGMYFASPNLAPHLTILQTPKTNMKLRGSSIFFPLRESRTSAKRCILRLMTMRIWTSSLPAVVSVTSSSRMHGTQARRIALSIQECARLTSGKSQHACLSSYQQLATR